MRPGTLIPLFILIGLASLSVACREKRVEKKTSKAEARAVAFAERKALVRFAKALRASRETTTEQSPKESLIAVSARVAAIEATGLPEDVATAFHAYKASWEDLGGAIRAGVGEEQCAALAGKTDAIGKKLREAMARHGFFEIGL